MKNIIIGTAGHVDHGKTTLIRALTGIETDRLREEQERGMSIELGFAHFTLPGGARAGIVDVPGHERFIKNMLMGATGMDMVVLVVAADEGVMPQTREHFDILRFLDVKAGVIALTKADLVDPEWLELVEDDVRSMVKGSFLQGAPAIAVSGTTGQGIPELIQALDEIATRASERIAAGPFRMPIDRVFSVPGFGTVVTGTMRSGVVRIGEPAELLPQGIGSRIRQIQVHGEKAEVARAGSRVALNLVGVEVSDASRGDVVIAAGSLEPTSMVDVRLEILGSLSHNIAHRSRVRFHTGAVELIGRIALLDREEARPGESVLAQIRLESPTAVGRGDRFVLRRYSPGNLLGGGAILDPHPRRHRRNQAGVIQSLLVREKGSPDELVSQSLLAAGPAARSAEEIAAATGLPKTEAAEAARDLVNATPRPLALAIGTRWVHADHLAELERQIGELLGAYHERNPLAPGIPREELRARAGRNLDTRVYSFCLARMEEQGNIAQESALVRLAGHEVRLEGAQARMADSLRDAYRRGNLNPPSVEEALSAAGPVEAARPLLEVLVFRGDLVKIAEGLYLEREALAAALEKARELLQDGGRFTVSQFRDAVGSSRKVVVPLLEYCDANRITRRQGDERVLY